MYNGYEIFRKIELICSLSCRDGQGYKILPLKNTHPSSALVVTSSNLQRNHLKTPPTPPTFKAAGVFNRFTEKKQEEK